VSHSSLGLPPWALIAPYLDEVLDLQRSERESWLAKFSERQPALVQTMRELLAELDTLKAGGFLEGAPPRPASATADLTGRPIGAYTIDRLLSRGGMGEVWVASRSDGRFEGRCAIKFVDQSIGYPKLTERFNREGRLLARLVHPNIARLLDAGVIEDGRQYLALEYVDGERIDDYCNSRALSVAARVRLFLDVVSAVSHAHSCLIIHRDLKPTNVLVSRDGVVKLLDFGIAKLLSAEYTAAGQDQTRIEETVLTPEYAAPEQLLGEAPSTATDVYQLGILLYVLLTGKLPFEASSRAERIKAATENPSPRASEAASGPLRKQLQGDLDAIVSMAMRKDPRERYATAAALHEDLQRYLDGEVVHARSGAALYHARKFIRRHRAAVSAAIVVMLTLLGAYITTTLELVEARKQREAARASARREEAVKIFLQGVLSEFQSRGEPLTSKSLLERSSALLKLQYGDQPDFVSEMLIELAREYADLMELNTAVQLMTEARDIARARNNAPLLAASECWLAKTRMRAGSTAEAQQLLAQGFQALARVPPARVDIHARCLSSQADIASALQDRAGAIEIQRKARAMLEAAGETHGMVYNVILAGLATDLMDDGQTAEALEIYRLSADVHARNGRGGTRSALIAEQNVASVLYRIGEVRESYEIIKRVHDKLLRLNSVEDYSVLATVNLAGDANRLALWDPAQNMLAAAVARAEKEGDLQNFRLGSFELARTRLRQNAARAEIEAPLDHLEAVRLQKNTPRAPGTEVLMASVRIDLDLRDGATHQASLRSRELLQFLADQNYKAPRPLYLAHSMAAKSALAEGDASRAAEQARLALKVIEPLARGPDTSADVGEALLLLARAQIAQGHSADAQAVLRRAIRCLSNGYGASHPATREAERLLATAKAHGI
jgi:eukaryotic-like serine/threonine-protein kinase